MSLSDLADRTMPDAAELADELGRRGVGLSLLVPPRPGVEVAGWVRQRRVAGDGLLLHGYGHRAARLPAHEAGLRLLGAQRFFDAHGLAADGFVPPRGLASAGTLAALRATGFRLCADTLAVRLLDSAAMLPGRVLGGGSDRAMVLGAARTSRRGGLVRLTVRADQLCRPGHRRAVLDAVDVALRHGARPDTYRALGRPLPAVAGVTTSMSGRAGYRTLPEAPVTGPDERWTGPDERWNDDLAEVLDCMAG